MAIRITHWKQWNENYYKRKTIDRKFFFHHIYTIHHHHHHHDCLKKKTLAENRGTRAAIFIRIIVGENFFKLEESQGMEPSDPNFRGSPLFSRFLPDFRGKIGALSSSRYIAPSISPKFLPLLHSCVGKSRRKKKKKQLLRLWRERVVLLQREPLLHFSASIKKNLLGCWTCHPRIIFHLILL